MFELEWPPRSGRRETFPEIDRVAWFAPAEARRRVKPAQIPFIDRLIAAVAGEFASSGAAPEAGEPHASTDAADGGG
jgi:predicted NUDIX family NTP pyrophosphohydrolase